jgi:hypothetical protein
MQAQVCNPYATHLRGAQMPPPVVAKRLRSGINETCQTLLPVVTYLLQNLPRTVVRGSTECGTTYNFERGET